MCYSGCSWEDGMGNCCFPRHMLNNEQWICYPCNEYYLELKLICKRINNNRNRNIKINKIKNKLLDKTL